MIVDGVEVLYTMRNGKIVDPNIPTDGLVCYLDARGKYNTDIYKNTLLDLSGNGNHGTLRNFNFTEESGYVEDVSDGSASGLKFDGVDDYIRINNINTLDITNEFTFMTELVVTKNNMKVQSIIHSGTQEDKTKPFVWLLLESGIQLRYNDNGTVKYNGLGKYEIGSTMRIALVYSSTGIIMYVNDRQFNCMYNAPVIVDNLQVFSYWGIGHFFEGIVDNFKLYNRALTEQEITKLMEVE